MVKGGLRRGALLTSLKQTVVILQKSDGYLVFRRGTGKDL
jgi:hypothetical protein